MDAANDGSAAPKLSRRHPYGLALLEYKMQGMDGVELSGHLIPLIEEVPGTP